MKLKQYIAELRGGVSRAFFASYIKGCRETIRLWEQGEACPTIQHLQMLRRSIGLDVNELLDTVELPKDMRKL